MIEIPNDAVPTITAGQHTIMVNLHENNHAVTNPPVEQTFQINPSKDLSLSGATSGAPGVTITAPAEAAGITQLPNTGQNDAGWTLAMVIVFVCTVLGGLMMFRSRVS